MSLIKAWDLSNKEINFASYGLYGLKLHVPSPSYQYVRESIPGRSGTITLGKDLLPRNLTADFRLEGHFYDDSIVLRDMLYKLFGNDFYIAESKLGKRWKVEPDDSWDPNRINNKVTSFSVPLVAGLGMAESVGTTLTEKTFNANSWQVGQGLMLDETKYKHTSTSFKIYNAGELIDPRRLPLLIQYKGASDNLKIKNNTTNEEWTYTGTSNIGDAILLNGIRPTKNGLAILRNTNRKIITLQHGWNDFQLSGTSGAFEITFDFRFYYL